MTIRIGFPVVIRDTAYPVWLSSGGGAVVWNGEPLRSSKPFGENTDLNEAVARLSDRGIAFECVPIRPKQERGFYFVPEIDGNSWELALDLAREFWMPHVAAPAGEVLVTGRTAVSPSPCPLKLLEAKLDLVSTAPRRILVMRLHDLSQIHRWASEYRLPGTLDEALAADRPLSFLPVESTPSGQLVWSTPQLPAWARGFGAWLGLSASPPAPVQLPAQAATPATTLEEPTATKGTLAEIFEKVVGSVVNPQWRDKFRRHNQARLQFPLLPIQEQALAHSNVCYGDPFEPPEGRNIVISGPTGCGKTSLVDSLMLNSAIAMAQPVLYIAPVRALAYERQRALRLWLPDDPLGIGLNPEKVIVSTGEVKEEDWRFARPDAFLIAVTVNEKANLLLQGDNPALLKSLGLVVFDEIHMLSDVHRGAPLDLLLAKCVREQTRRRSQGGDALRIVMLSTEGHLAQSEALTKTLSDPLALATSERPVRSTHEICLLKRDGSPSARRIEISTFQAARSLTKEQMAHAAMAISAAAQAVEQEEVARGERPLLRYLLRDLKKLYPNGTVLVAIPSIRRLMNEASMLRKDLSREAALPIPAEILEQLGDVGAQDHLQGRLQSFAKHGIFVHHADLEMGLREAVEAHFAKRTDGFRVLFATETLTWGVNLVIDCVVLPTLEWPREGADGLIDDKQPLTPTEFHNLVGRAGRRGLSEHGRVIICRDASRLTASVKVMRFLLEYYGTSPKRQLSTLVDVQDAAHLPGTSLDRFSRNTFLATVDALRFLQTQNLPYGAPSDLYGALLCQTVFANDSSVTLGRTSSLPDAFIDLMHKVLTAANTASIVTTSRSGDGKIAFKRTAKADALLDTGTSYRSVAPMKSWLDKSLGRFDHLDAEVLVPALIQSSDLWNQAKRFAPSDEDPDRSPPADASNRLITLRDCLGRELRHLAFTEEDVQDFTGALLAERPDLASKLVLLRLLVAFLRWLRGAPLEEVQAVSLHLVPSPGTREFSNQAEQARPFRTAYKDRIHWLATMMLRYFDSNEIAVRHQRQLPILIERLRLGVPTAAIPYVAQRRVPREMAMKLLSAGVTPAGLVSGRANQEALRRLAQNKVASVVRSAASHFASEIRKFFDALRQFIDHDHAPFLDPLEQNLLSFLAVNREGALPVRTNEQYFAFLTHLDRFVSALFPRSRDSNPRCARDGHLFRFRLGTTESWTVATQGRGDLSISYPWANPEGSTMSTLCLLLLIVVVREPKLLVATDITGWRREAGPKAVSSLLSRLNIAADRSDAKEKLWGFMEPGALSERPPGVLLRGELTNGRATGVALPSPT